MEQQAPISATEVQSSPASSEFTIGTAVIYALHGKCNVTGIESRTIGNEQLRFYKLEIQKSALSRSTRQEPAIWLPIQSAKDRGLRLPMSAQEIDQAWAILSSREYYFPVQDTWQAVQPKLEAAIRTEGGAGLAKVVSFLHVLKKRLIVAPSEILKFSESVNKVFLRELSELSGQPIRALEERMNKSLRHKLIPDN